jgi:hypothetical protein
MKSSALLLCEGTDNVQFQYQASQLWSKEHGCGKSGFAHTQSHVTDRMMQFAHAVAGNQQLTGSSVLG